MTSASIISRCAQNGSVAIFLNKVMQANQFVGEKLLFSIVYKILFLPTVDKKPTYGVFASD
jgi:hypothetical protein